MSTEDEARPSGSEPSVAEELQGLRAIAEAARYIHGPSDCFDLECDDFYDKEGDPLDPRPEHCSHMTVRYATADDADAALWLPQMVRLLEQEVESLRGRLELTKSRAASGKGDEA